MKKERKTKTKTVTRKGATESYPKKEAKIQHALVTKVFPKLAAEGIFTAFGIDGCIACIEHWLKPLADEAKCRAFVVLASAQLECARLDAFFGEKITALKFNYGFLREEEDEQAKTKALGERFQKLAQEAGLAVHWDGDPGRTIGISLKGDKPQWED